MAVPVYNSMYAPYIGSLADHFVVVSNESSNGIILKRYVKGDCLVCHVEHGLAENIMNMLIKLNNNVYFSCSEDLEHSLLLCIDSDSSVGAESVTPKTKKSEKKSKGDMSLLTRAELDPNWPKEIRTTQWLGDLPENWQCLAVIAKLGRGKTTSEVRWVAKHGRGRRILFPICRVINGPALKNALIQEGVDWKITLYSDVPNWVPLIASTQIIEAESMLRVPVFMRKKGYIVMMDELEGILAEFSSPTMDGRRVECYRALWDILIHSEGMLFMDALMGGRSIAWIRAICKAKKWIPSFIIHDPMIREMDLRVAVDVGVWEELVRIGIEALRAQKRVVLVSASRQKLVQFYDTMKEQLGIEILIYHSRAGAERRRDLDNVEVAWATVQCVGYSPSITVSLSCRGPFNTLLVWGSTYSCVVRDLIQSMHRIRTFSEKEIYFALYDLPPRNVGVMRCTLQAHKGALKWEQKNTELLERELGLSEYMYPKEEELPDAVLENEIWNRLEKDVSRLFFRDMLYEYFARCDIVVGEKRINMHTPIMLEEVPDVGYDDIIIVGSVDELRKKVITKQATSEELAQWSKLEFLRVLEKESTEEQKRDIYNSLWRDKKSRDLIDNIRYDLHNRDLQKLLYLGVTSEARGLVNKRVSQLIEIRRLCESLGIPNCYERVVIKRSRMEKLEGVDKNTLRKTFNKPYQGKEKEKQEDFRANMLLVNSILKVWCGSSVERDGNVRITMEDKTRIQIEDVILIPIHPTLFELLRI